MHFTTFIINAVTFAKIKSSLDQRHELERALKESREQLKQVANAAHLCPQCHRPYVPQALRAKPEESLAARTSEAVSVAPSDGRGNQFSRIC